MSITKPITDEQLIKMDQRRQDIQSRVSFWLYTEEWDALRERLRHVEQVLKYEKLENDELRESVRLAEAVVEAAEGLDVYGDIDGDLGVQINAREVKKVLGAVDAYRAAIGNGGGV